MKLRLVLVGAGHAHVEVLRRFAVSPPDADVLLISEPGHSIYSGMIPGIIEGRYRLADATIDVDRLALLAGAARTQGRVRGIDRVAGQVLLEDGTEHSFDLLSLDIGSGADRSRTSLQSFTARPVHRLLREVERWRASPPAESIEIVGGGPAGVELAFALVAGGLTRRASILESDPRLLPALPRALSDRVAELAAVRGIQVLVGHRAPENPPDDALDGTGLTGVVRRRIWATGGSAHPWLAESLPVEAKGFLRTRNTLQVEGHDHIFASGDCASLLDHPHLPKAGVYAVRQGPILHHNLRASLEGRTLIPYTPQAQALVLLNLGKGMGAGARGRWHASGGWVMQLKDRIDRRWIERYR